MRPSQVLYCCLAATLTLAGPLHAGVVTASGAGLFPSSAQDLTGLAPTEVVGSLSSDPNDVNVFAIEIFDPVAFSALTIYTGAFGIPDTELFLFDSAGLGVYYNDDISGANTQSCLPSADALNPCPSAAGGLGPTAAGLYYLAITRSANLPLDNGFGSDLFMTSFDSTGIYGPDPFAGGSNPVAAWDGGSFASPNTDLINYDILLTGTAAPSVPEPASALLVGGALLALAVRKPRKKNRN